MAQSHVLFDSNAQLHGKTRCFVYREPSEAAGRGEHNGASGFLHGARRCDFTQESSLRALFLEPFWLK